MFFIWVHTCYLSFVIPKDFIQKSNRTCFLILPHNTLHRSKHGLSYSQELNGVQRKTEEVLLAYLSFRVLKEHTHFVLQCCHPLGWGLGTSGPTGRAVGHFLYSLSVSLGSQIWTDKNFCGSSYTHIWYQVIFHSFCTWPGNLGCREKGEK